MLEDNILSNENHPSMLLWSIGNELPSPATGAEARYIAGAAALAKKLDPTRPVGMAVSNWPGLGCQSAYGPLDVIGDNEYFGWFDAGGGGDDDRDALGPFLDTVRACYPTKAIMITEFGFDADRDGPVEERGTYAFQANSVAFHLGRVRDQAVAVGGDVLRAPGLRGVPDLLGRRPPPGPALQPEGLVDFPGTEAGVVGGVADLPLDAADRSEPPGAGRAVRPAPVGATHPWDPLAAIRAGGCAACPRLARRVLASVRCRPPPNYAARPLYDRHAAAGAKLVPFAGWEMPVQYAGIREEHLAVRTRRRRVRRLAHGPGRDHRPAGGSSSSSGWCRTTCAGSPRAALSTA